MIADLEALNAEQLADRIGHADAIVFAAGADPQADDDGGFGTYLRAKGQADEKVIASGLDYTVVRPGSLANDPGTGAVTIGPDVEPGPITRDDVAATLAELLATSESPKLVLNLRGGGLPVADAVAVLCNA